MFLFKEKQQEIRNLSLVVGAIWSFSGFDNGSSWGRFRDVLAEEGLAFSAKLKILSIIHTNCYLPFLFTFFFFPLFSFNKFEFVNNMRRKEEEEKTKRALPKDCSSETGK